MAFKLTPYHTEKRQRWLETLLEKPGTNRAGVGNVACHCMRLGWTEWTDGLTGERLTDAGLAKLGEWKEPVPTLAVTGWPTTNRTKEKKHE